MKTDVAGSTQSAEKLSVLIPAFNECYTIEALIEKVLRAPLPDGVERELIVVDDCSTDRTWEVLKKVASEHPDHIKLFRHDRNQGKGAAIRTAIEHATGTICVVQDADLEYDPRDYATLLAPILDGDADAVFGSRFVARHRRRVLYFWHSAGNRFLTMLSNLFTNLNLTDMETCYKAVRTDILKSIPIRCNRFGIEPELTAKLAKRGCHIYEVPISYRGRTYNEGKKITWWDGVKAVFVIIYFWLRDDVYNEHYGHAILHRLSSAHRFNGWMADQIRPYVGDSVLEIGAGLGNLSNKLLPRARYTASDIDPLHLRFLSNQFAARPSVSVAKVNLESAEDFAALPHKHDTIVCLNVVEHVEHDDVALKNMYEALTPGGRALVLVPRGMWLYGSLDEVLEHYRRYSEEELTARCREAGFEIERLFTFNRVSVFPWYLNARILKRRHFGKLQLKIFDSTVWFWKLFDRLLPWKGLSLIVVARKPQHASGGGDVDESVHRDATRETDPSPPELQKAT